MTPATRAYILSNLNLSDAEIVAELAKQPPVTAQSIPLNQLAPLLRKLGLMFRLKAVLADANTPVEVKAGLTEFLDQLGDVRVTNLDTTDAVIATRTAAILGALQAAKQIDATSVGAIYALGGGLSYGAVTEAEVAAVRKRETAMADFRARRQKMTDLWNTRSALCDQYEAAIAAGDDATAPTDEELGL